ncbi:MAG: radical SAM family heme chaperone HemW [Desulfobulbaceae bacterium]
MRPCAEVWTPAELGLYLHIPFCLRKCPYCSFFSVPASRELIRCYGLALRRQIAGTTAGRPVTTVFFGGGTPSILPAEELATLLAACRAQLPWAEEAEVSIEANPATIDAKGLGVLRRAGFNRLSVGVQSLDDAELQVLGRPHNAAEARAVVRAARSVGFHNLNLDLMYGLPGQTAEGWRQTLRAALELDPEHLALYELTIEERTPFARLSEEGRLALPPEGEVLAMMAITAEETAGAGFVRYEISNYARPGRQCRHNLNYWHNGDYFGLGAGAVACLAGLRCAAVRDIEQYCLLIESGQEPWAEAEELDPEASLRETVVMGLRLTAGISLTELEARFNLNVLQYYGSTLRRLAEQGLLVQANGNLRLTARGLNLANQVMAELV